MNRTRERLSKLSFSMPDVTGAGYSPSPGLLRSFSRNCKRVGGGRTDERGGQVSKAFVEGGAACRNREAKLVSL